MRKLVWFTLGFASVCAICTCLWLTHSLWIGALCLTAASAALGVPSRRFRWLRCPAVLFFGCAVGLLWFPFYADAYLSNAAALDGTVAEATAYCTDYSYETDYGAAVEGVLLLQGKPVRAKFYVDENGNMEPGDVLRGTFRFRVTTPDGSEEPTFHQGRGIFLLAYQQKGRMEHQKPAQAPVWTFATRLRRDLRTMLEHYFPADASGFAKALLLGDRTGIDYEMNTAFKQSGISHIIAVSGLHVAILFTLVNTFCFKRRWLAALLGVPTLVLFAAVVGFTPSITRACIMQCLMMTAMLVNKEYDGPTELAFSCLVMLFANPLVITSSSFQLSVACMIGIFLLRGRIYDYLTGKLITKKRNRFAKAKRWFSNSVAVTLSTMVTTTPLSALYFGTVSLLGVLTNLLTLWVVGFIFYGLILVCVLGLFWPVAASAVALVLAWPIRYVIAVAKAIAAFPLAAVYTASIYIVLWLVFCYVLLPAFLLSRHKRPGVLFCCVMIGLCLSLVVSWAEPLTDACRMSVLDVGQGQCILLQSQGKTFLVDCGGSDAEDAADIAAEMLLSQGVFRLDGVIVTHFDVDHVGGMKFLLSRIPADVLFVPDCTDDRGILQQLTPMAGQTIRVREDLLLTYADTKITVFGPAATDSGNENSLAILFCRENCDILITGDRSDFGERVLMKTAQLPKLDILVVGHHGAGDATGQALLAATNPEVAVISVGENRFGHPSQQVLDRLAAAGCTVYRTDIHGNVVCRR